ncbi:MAG: hypothetical protein WAL98_18195 [Desulfatiglandaceae bacterium]
MFDTLIAGIAKTFSKASLPYMIIGGQAVLLHGTPRMTKDIDITLGVDIDSLETVTAAVAAAGLEVIPEDFRPFVKETYVLPTRDAAGGIRVNFIFSFTHYERQAIARAKVVSLLETPVMFAAVKDMVIHKIFASPRDLEDVRSILIKNSDIDVPYVRNWIEKFDEPDQEKGLLRIFEEILKKTRDSP